MSDGPSKKNVTELPKDAYDQLEQHKEWLRKNLRAILADATGIAIKDTLIAQVDDIRVRVALLNQAGVTIVYDYPDELGAFLKQQTVGELAKALAGGAVVSLDQPMTSVVRGPDTPGAKKA